MSVPEFSVDLHRLVAGWAAGLPEYVGTAADIATDAVVGVFVLLFALLLWRARREGSRDEQARAIVAPVAMVVAYLVSRTAKSLVEQDRPCRTMDVISECPPVGDWSFPSNHSAIAGAAAVAIVMCDRRQRWVVPVALLAGASRVFVGVHYPHDVLAGLLLGALVAAIMQKLAPLLPVPTWFAAAGNPAVAPAAERGADPRPDARETYDDGRAAGHGDGVAAARAGGRASLRDGERDAVAAKAEAALVSAAVNAAVSAAVGAAMGGPEAKAASRSIAASKVLAEAARAELRRTSGDEPAQPTPTRVAPVPAATRVERLPDTDPTTAVQVAVTGAGDEATRMVQVSVVGATPTRALPTPALPTAAAAALRTQTPGAEPTRAPAMQGADQTRALFAPGADQTRALPVPGADPTRALSAPGADQTRALSGPGGEPTKAVSTPGGAAATRAVQAPGGGAAHLPGADATRVQPVGAGAGAESTRMVRLPGARPDRGQAETEVLARVSSDDAPPPRVESTRMVPLSGTTGAPPQVPAPLNLTRALPRSGSLQGLAGAPGGRRRAADQATVPAAEPVTPIPNTQGPNTQGPNTPPGATPPASTPPAVTPPAINPAAAAALAADLPAASTPATALFAAPGNPVATPAPAGFPGGRPTDPDAADTAVIHGLFHNGDHGPAATPAATPAAPPAPSQAPLQVPSPTPAANSTPAAAPAALPTPPDSPRAPRRPVPPRDPATTDVLPRI
ncbi:phosphatase PAP2 family protein [Actinosynnema mirum]|uniref:Phosphoesterase PA-phosphatase related n=1 Tax=Actinosynnema mirum (strain ATCC 29888 / DSM 43827 / JCM 3225 / NBRC 14064 / NCIMB 13271 / NRRL B-12336 / IMRU 3971 / 101) TaxID=446462 RepID=C6WBH4_ACTMD|nr:phosphatase PAP2 family protein [Actinosynnema mirum]ACU35542.1 phosphoesterase PA-phosphatase related [Actinosynnema mirum DSM 43827]